MNYPSWQKFELKARVSCVAIAVFLGIRDAIFFRGRQWRIAVFYAISQSISTGAQCISSLDLRGEQLTKIQGQNVLEIPQKGQISMCPLHRWN